MRDLLNRLRYWAGSLVFDIKYKLAIAKEGKDFITCGQEDENTDPLPEEFRCCICKSRHDCPACETGVIFPCAYFKEEHHG